MLHDLRVSFRAIRARPGVAAVIVLSIAVGIGVNTTVFSWIQARVLNPIPGVAGGGRFYLLEARSEIGTYPGWSWLEYRDLSRRLATTREVLAFRIAPFSIGAAEWSDRMFGMLVSGSYFPALGLNPAVGRLFDARDTAAPGGPSILVVSHRFWQTRLEGAPDVAGRILRVNDRPFTIVGVAPRGFQGTVLGLTFDLFVPATAAPVLSAGSRELEDRGQRGYLAMAALAAGVSRTDAQRELDAAMAELAAAYPDTNRTIRGQLLPPWQSPRGPQQSLTVALVMLQGVMLLVLLVVAGNTTNLVLSRASGRQHEVGVMLALGAGRWRVVRLLLTENVLLAVGGALLGAAAAVWGTTAIRDVPFPTPAGMQVTFETTVDAVSLAFSAALGVFAGILIGLPAGVQLARTAPFVAMKGGATTQARSALRETFLVLEVALAMVVLVVAARFLKSFNDTQTTDPGFTREGVLLAAYDTRGRARSMTAADAREFTAKLLERLQAVPGVETAAVAGSVPLDIHGMPSRFVAIEGRARADDQLDQALANTTTPGYFQALAIPFVEGADFVDLRDTTRPPEAIVNETFVKRLIGPGSAIGRRLETGGNTYTIVGVVRDSLYNAYGEDPAPFLYLSLRDRPATQGEIHLRTRPGAELDVLPAVRSAVRELDRTLPLFNIRTLGAHVESNLVFQRIPARMFAVLGPLLLVLVAVGIYAVAAYAVSLRRREIGTRLALGATSGQVIRTLVGSTLRLVAYGMVAGVAVALVMGRGVPDAGQVGLAAAVSALFLASAAVATWLSARQVDQIDPINVLKEP
jgi:predicted permease